MNPTADRLKLLSPALRQRFEQAMSQFKQNWNNKLMSETLTQLAPGHALRYPSLVEMTRIDLAERWKRGETPKLEDYLKAYPELGSIHTLPVDLIQSEYEIREANGDLVALTEYAQRFPTQFEELTRARLGGGKSTSADQEPQPLSPVVAALGGGYTAPAARQTSRPEPFPAARKKRSWARRILIGVPLLLIATAAGLWGAGVLKIPKDAVDVVRNHLGLGGANNGNPPPVVAEKPAPAVAENPASVAAGNLTPEEPVQSITLNLELGAGSATDESVYLDLGLGFPLWLVPGNSMPAPVPFGAVPQESNAKTERAPSTTASFTFRTDGEPGRDVLRTSPQLLKGIKVGDIRRIGFASMAQQDWELAGFELLVNGKTLHSAKGLKLRPKQLQAAAMDKLSKHSAQSEPVDKEFADLREIQQNGFELDDKQKARLKELLIQCARWVGCCEPAGKPWHL